MTAIDLKITISNYPLEKDHSNKHIKVCVRWNPVIWTTQMFCLTFWFQKKDFLVVTTFLTTFLLQPFLSKLIYKTGKLMIGISIRYSTFIGSSKYYRNLLY